MATLAGTTIPAASPLPAPPSSESTKPKTPLDIKLKYVQYNHDLEKQYLPGIRAMIAKDLSEPYSIYVFRYFLYQWANLCFLALNVEDDSLVGCVICKLEIHASRSPATRRGYIAMLAVESDYRGHGIATSLVKLCVDAMASLQADEIVLETEETNRSAISLYERLGFLRTKKLHRYYLNGTSAYRLVLMLKDADPEALRYELANGESFMQHSI